MLQSRFSIPLIAFFVLAIAGCMLYLVKTENIFKTYFTKQYASAVTAGGDEQNIASSRVIEQEKSELEKELDDTDSKSAKKFLKPVPDDTNDATEPDISGTDKSVADTPAVNDLKNNSAEPVVVASNHEDDIHFPATDARSWWKKYSQDIPKLYSAPLTKDTEEKLGLVAQWSGELDLLYVENKSEWRRRFDEVSKDLVSMAVAGEREGASALSFQLVRPPLNNRVDALSWALIANAIAPNDYYLYLCSESFSACTEAEFVLASAQANKYINVNGFVIKK